MFCMLAHAKRYAFAQCCISGCMAVSRHHAAAVFVNHVTPTLPILDVRCSQVLKGTYKIPYLPKTTVRMHATAGLG